MARVTSLIVSVAVLFVCAGDPSPARGQTTGTAASPDTTVTYGWMGIHFGLTAPRGARAQFGLFNHVHPPHLFRVRLVGGDVRGGGFFGSVEGLYGRTTTWRFGRASLAGGLTIGEMGPLFEADGAFLGVPLEATVQLLPPHVRSVGLELGVHANVNLRRSFAGVSAGLVIGTLR
jgi:hypothetical protein